MRSDELNFLENLNYISSVDNSIPTSLQRTCGKTLSNHNHTPDGLLPSSVPLLSGA